jgi:hypothetical protein
MCIKSFAVFGRLISLVFRKKRRQADSCDVYLTSTPATTIRAAGGAAFISPSSSSAQRLHHATIFHTAESVHHTSIPPQIFLHAAAPVKAQPKRSARKRCARSGDADNNRTAL